MVTIAELQARVKRRFKTIQAKRAQTEQGRKFLKARKAQFRVPKGFGSRRGRVKGKRTATRKIEFNDPITGRLIREKIPKGPGFAERREEIITSVARRAILQKEARGQKVDPKLRERFFPGEPVPPSQIPEPTTVEQPIQPAVIRARERRESPEGIALALAAGQQSQKGSPKFEALRARRLAEAKRKIRAPTTVERRFKIPEGEIIIQGEVTPFAPRKISGIGVGTRAKRLREAAPATEISAAPSKIQQIGLFFGEVGRKTAEPFVQSFKELRAARVDVNLPPRPRAVEQLINIQSPTQVTRPQGLTRFFDITTGVGRQIGRQAPTAVGVGATLGAFTAAAFLAPAALTSPVVLIPAIEVAKFTTTGKPTTLKRAAETTTQVLAFEALGRGAQIIGRKVTGKVKQAQFEKKIGAFERQAAVPSPEPIQVSLLKGQTQFVKVTETGQVIPQFRTGVPKPTFQRVTESGRVISQIKPQTQTTFLQRTETGLPVNVLGFKAPEIKPIPFKIKRQPTQLKLIKRTPEGIQQRFGDGEDPLPFLFLERTVPSRASFKGTFRALAKSKRGQLQAPRFQELTTIQVTREAQISRPTTRLGIRESLLVSPVLATALDQSQQIESKIKPVVAIRSDLGLSIQPKLRQRERSKLKPIIDISQEIAQPTRQRQEDETRITPIIDFDIVPELDIPTPPQITIGVPEAVIKKTTDKTTPFFFPTFELTAKERKQQKVKAFDSFAKEKGKFIKLNEKPQTKNRAINNVLGVVDNSPSATGKIVTSKMKIRPRPEIPIDTRIFKFKQIGNTFQEKNKFRIDSQGELQGITVKGLLAQRKRALSFL